jgi:3(or 17)beta-hydroxysteroid dehydrogenase
VHPGVMQERMAVVLGPRTSANPEHIRRLVADTPMGRMGTADDVAYGALYLASDESRFVTGIELVIDGGYVAR